MSRLLWRLLAVVPTLFGVVVVTFLLTRVLPGDPAVFFASNPAMSAADIEAVRASLGLDRPLAAQFGLYLGDLLRGDLGTSLTTGQSVTVELARRLPASAELTLLAFALAVALSLPLGILAALRPGSWLDHIARVVATLGAAMPSFVTGLLLIFLFYVLAGWAPEPIGRLDPFLAEPPRLTGFLTLDALIAGDWRLAGAAFARLVLPAATMALFALAPLTRITRAAMLEVLGAEFIRTARAAGLGGRKVVLTYALGNALVPVLTTMGMVVSYMLGANVLVEKVFSWPGVGAFAVDCVLNLDYAPLQGFMLLMAGIFLLVTLGVDLAIALIDPRARL